MEACTEGVVVDSFLYSMSLFKIQVQEGDKHYPFSSQQWTNLSRGEEMWAGHTPPPHIQPL